MPRKTDTFWAIQLTVPGRKSPLHATKGEGRDQLGHALSQVITEAKRHQGASITIDVGRKAA